MPRFLAVLRFVLLLSTYENDWFPLIFHFLCVCDVCVRVCSVHCAAWVITIQMNGNSRVLVALKVLISSLLCSPYGFHTVIVLSPKSHMISFCIVCV